MQKERAVMIYREDLLSLGPSASLYIYMGKLAKAGKEPQEKSSQSNP